jgi:hypothetical protein
MSAPSTLSGYFYFENAAAKITREQAGYIRLQMQPGQQTTTDIRTMFEQSLLATRISGFDKLLFDHRLAAPFVEEAKEWFEHIFLPLMATDLAARRIAVTVAYDVFCTSIDGAIVGGRLSTWEPRSLIRKRGGGLDLAPE